MCFVKGLANYTKYVLNKDKEGEISMLREQVRRAKEDGKTEFRNSDGFLNELCNCYNNGFQECLHQVKALHPSLDVSQVSLDNVAWSPTRTFNQEDTDEILMADPMPNIQVDGEAAPEDEQVKSVGARIVLLWGGWARKICGWRNPCRPALVFFCKIYYGVLFLFLFHCGNPFENNGYVIFNIAHKFLGFYL